MRIRICVEGRQGPVLDVDVSHNGSLDVLVRQPWMGFVEISDKDRLEPDRIIRSGCLASCFCNDALLIVPEGVGPGGYSGAFGEGRRSRVSGQRAKASISCNVQSRIV